MTDTWDAPVSVGDPTSLESWNLAWADFNHFQGDPFARLADSNKNDNGFALGSVFCATYRVLGGVPLTDPQIRMEHSWAKERASDLRELGHAEALNHIVTGNFTLAAECWDNIAANTRDFAAVRFAHDVYLHIGDDARRLASSQRAMKTWAPDDVGWGFVASQHSFALEEVGLYDEAAELGWRALEVDPLDLWALHALAHVYESTGDQAASLSLMLDRRDTWSQQDSLAVHIWWHLALRLIASGQYELALDIHDEQVTAATTPFRLCDLSSLLWRLELAGVDVGDRWDYLCDAVAARPERHTAGFLDVHSALVFTRRPDHQAAAGFFAGLAQSHLSGASENDQIFASVVKPLVSAVRASVSDPAAAVALFDSVADKTHRIGGSIAQRDLIKNTRDALEAK